VRRLPREMECYGNTQALPLEEQGYRCRAPALSAKINCQGGCSSMVELQLPKLLTWVRFPSPAPPCSPLTYYSHRDLGGAGANLRSPMASCGLFLGKARLRRGNDEFHPIRQKDPRRFHLNCVFAIGMMDATRHPAAARTRVWLMRNVLSSAGLPGRPRVKVTGTRICWTSSESWVDRNWLISGSRCHVPA
jgi:hypothetical protein